LDCNHTIICGRINKLGILRYSPAGVAVIEFTVDHLSRQIEAGVARQIRCEIHAVALGQLAMTIAEFQIESRLKLTGFLNRKSHKDHQLVLHAQQVALI